MQKNNKLIAQAYVLAKTKIYSETGMIAPKNAGYVVIDENIVLALNLVVKNEY